MRLEKKESVQERICLIMLFLFMLTCHIRLHPFKNITVKRKRSKRSRYNNINGLNSSVSSLNESYASSMNVLYDNNMTECKELDSGVLSAKEKDDESGFELYETEIKKRISGEMMNLEESELVQDAYSKRNNCNSHFQQKKQLKMKASPRWQIGSHFATLANTEKLNPECTNGGKWSVTSNRKANLETMWLETLMALIGEQFDETDDICGVVASVRPRQDKLALWTRTAANEAAQMGIGRKWKEVIDVNDKIIYSSHDDSRQRSTKGRYSV